MTIRPEDLVSSTPVPAWASDAEATKRDGFGYECYELTRGSETIGWLYDNGSGYDFAEGWLNRPEPFEEAGLR